MCLEAAGRTARLVSIEQRSRPEKSEVGLLVSDSSKAKKLLGWSPEVALSDGLRATAEFVRTHLDDYDAGGYVV
jgi:nucleoside-diphosphate-sugar epimerase